MNARLVRTYLPGLALLVSVAMPVEAQSLLSNSGFARSLAGWTVIGNAKWYTEDAAGQPNSGSLQLHSDANVGNYGLGILQCTGAIPGAIYRLSAKMKVPQQGKSGNAGVALGFFSKPGCQGQLPQYAQFFSSASSWIGKHVDIAAPTAAVSVGAYVSVEQVGGLDVLIDDVGLAVIPSPRPPSPPFVLTNSGFDSSIGNWTVIGDATWNSEDSSGDPASGSLQLHTDANVGNYGQGVMQCAAATPGTAYRLSAKMKVPPKGVTGNAGVAVSFFAAKNCQDGLPQFAQFFSSAPEWTSKEVDLTAPAGALSVSVSAAVEQVGGLDVLIDDLALAALSSSTPPPPPPQAGIIIVPDTIYAGESATVSWSGSDAQGYSVWFGDHGESVPPSGSRTVTPSATSGYALQSSINAGAGDIYATAYTKLKVLTAPPPVITDFSFSWANGSLTLRWSTTSATEVHLTGGADPSSVLLRTPLPPTGSFSPPAPQTTVTFILTAVGSEGATTSAPLTVPAGGVAPSVATTVAGVRGLAGSNDGVSAQATFTRPFAVAVRPLTSARSVSDASEGGDMFILDANHTIRRVSSDGRTETYAGKAGVRGSNNGFRTSASFDFTNYSGGIVANGDGSLDVIDANGRARHIDSAGNVTASCKSASCARFVVSIPGGMARLSNGTIVVSDAGTHTLALISPDGIVTTVGRTNQSGFHDGASSVARFYRPRGLTVDSDGSILVLDTGNNAIRRVSPAGTVSTFARFDTITGALDLGCCANGIAVTPAGSVYVSDPGSNSIKEVHSRGAVTVVVAPAGSDSSGALDNPLGMARRPDGAIVVTDTNNNTIRVVGSSASPRRRVVRH